MLLRSIVPVDDRPVIQGIDHQVEVSVIVKISIGGTVTDRLSAEPPCGSYIAEAEIMVVMEKIIGHFGGRHLLHSCK